MVLSHSADLRYVGQFNEVEVPAFEGGNVTAQNLQTLVDHFHTQHDALYGYNMRGAPVELINLRVTIRGITEKPVLEKLPAGGPDPSTAQTGKRKAYFGGEFIEVPVYDGLQLINGNLVQGPAIVVQPTTTILVTPEYDLLCDEFGNYLLSPKGKDMEQLRKILQSGRQIKVR